MITRVELNCAKAMHGVHYVLRLI